jgi:hypothetical protein
MHLPTVARSVPAGPSGQVLSDVKVVRGDLGFGRLSGVIFGG